MSLSLQTFTQPASSHRHFRQAMTQLIAKVSKKMKQKANNVPVLMSMAAASDEVITVCNNNRCIYHVPLSYDVISGDWF